MRLKVSLQLERETAVPLNSQHLLTAVVYRFLEYSNADYAAFLHGKGYAPDQDDQRRFKLFCFSPIRSRRRRVAGDNLILGTGAAEWLVSSPVEQFLSEFASGLLSSGHLRVGNAILPIANVETLPAPPIEYSMSFKCLSPIVAAVAERNAQKSWTRFLRPKDPDFSDRVRANLLNKYRAFSFSLRLCQKLQCLHQETCATGRRTFVEGLPGGGFVFVVMVRAFAVRFQPRQAHRVPD